MSVISNYHMEKNPEIRRGLPQISRFLQNVAAAEDGEELWAPLSLKNPSATSALRESFQGSHRTSPEGIEADGNLASRMLHHGC